MMSIIINILGWLGSLLLIVAYYQNSKNKLSAQSSSYQLLNIIGSLFLIVNTIFYGAYPSSAANVIWVFIGIHHLIKNINYGKKVH